MKRVWMLLLGCLPLLANAQQGPGRIQDADLRAWLGTLRLEARLDADVPAARAAVASHLARSRFARAEADAVVVTNGAADGMRRA